MRLPHQALALERSGAGGFNSRAVLPSGCSVFKQIACAGALAACAAVCVGSFGTACAQCLAGIGAAGCIDCV